MRKRKLKMKPFIIILFILVALFVILFFTNNLNSKPTKKAESIKSTATDNNNLNSKKKMSLIAVGDVLIHESVYKDAYDGNNYNFSKMFTNIKPILNKYDLRFCNQESIIGGSVLGISGYPAFNSPDGIGDELISLGFNLISLANNHAYDKGEDAILYSNSYWQSKNAIVSGTYSNNSDSEKVKVGEKNGIKYAFLTYTTSLNGTPKKDYLVNMYNPNKVKKDIESIKDRVDVIIVSMHWGEEYTNTPTKEQIEIANYLSNLGVNLIIGHHPHVVQPVTYINNTLVIYSLGNFISNQLSIGLNQGIGLIVGMDIIVDKDKVTFDNLYKELILSYAEKSTNFKVIPFSQLTDNLLENYKSINDKYMNIVNSEV